MLGMTDRARIPLYDGGTRLVMLHDRTEDRRLDMRPIHCVRLGHGHEIRAEENTRSSIHRENAGGQRRRARSL